ncbi:hypothetical protein J1N35_044706 [Gossypium stocksii]|uniref:Uncharacterized protein n=1 Tax=Gossypium stocksii TaxID=47602 RepID=A0A9D3U9S1_9ROSI|nr:hypothetical protein J1N35_044706 [Gossypium stocksii]
MFEQEQPNILQVYLIDQLHFGPICMMSLFFLLLLYYDPNSVILPTSLLIAISEDKLQKHYLVKYHGCIFIFFYCLRYSFISFQYSNPLPIHIFLHFKFILFITMRFFSLSNS